MGFFEKLFMIFAVLTVVVAASGCYHPIDPIFPPEEKFLPERTLFSAPFPNTDLAVAYSGLNVVDVPLVNNLGYPVTLRLTGNLMLEDGTVCLNHVMRGTYNGAEIISDVTTIGNGERFILTWDCDDYYPPDGAYFKAALSFEYMDLVNGYGGTHLGQVTAKYQEIPTAQ
jgi:hypothetical protein